MIKFSHTIFAFPFALAGVALSIRSTGSIPTGLQVLWICLAMVGARTSAMGLNRILDAKIDAVNPRTASRHIPAGRVGLADAWVMTIAATLLLLYSAWKLNPLCLYLAPVALAGFVLYTLSKRFTPYAHVILGLCLSAAPVGAWIALRGDIGLPIILFGGAVLFWVAGFDIFYALQDMEFDKDQGLHSIPSRFGEVTAFRIARIFHMLMVVLLVATGLLLSMGVFYYLGVTIAAAILWYEHQLVHPGDLTLLDAAFFTMNGYISIILFLFTAFDTWWSFA